MHVHEPRNRVRRSFWVLGEAGGAERKAADLRTKSANVSTCPMMARSPGAAGLCCGESSRMWWPPLAASGTPCRSW